CWRGAADEHLPGAVARGARELSNVCAAGARARHRGRSAPRQNRRLQSGPALALANRVRQPLSNRKGERMNSKALKVTTGLKAGRIGLTHSRSLKVTTGVKGGRIAVNHSRSLKV